MEKERRIRKLTVVALVVAVLGLTVAFAALSQTLTINGTASVDSASWDIHFANLTGPDIEGGAEAQGSPTLNATTISGLNMSVTKPGDSVTYYFDIVNAGTIDAVLNTDLSTNLFYNNSFLGCFGIGESSPNWEECKKYNFDENKVINNNDYAAMGVFDYMIYDVDTNEKLTRNDIIEKGTTKHCKLVFAIKPESEYLSKEQRTFEDEITLEFVQE